MALVDVSEFECDKLSDDTRTTEKDAALRLAVTQLAGEFGKESMLCLQRFFSSRNAPVISTGSLKLDLALGIGGLPKVSNCKLNSSSALYLIHSCTFGIGMCLQLKFVSG